MEILILMERLFNPARVAIPVDGNDVRRNVLRTGNSSALVKVVLLYVQLLLKLEILFVFSLEENRPIVLGLKEIFSCFWENVLLTD